MLYFSVLSIWLAFNNIFNDFGYVPTKELHLPNAGSIFPVILRIYDLNVMVKGLFKFCLSCLVPFLQTLANWKTFTCSKLTIETRRSGTFIVNLIFNLLHTLF